MYYLKTPLGGNLASQLKYTINKLTQKTYYTSFKIKISDIYFLLLLLGSRHIKENKIDYYNFRICVCYKDHSGFKKTHLASIQEISPHKKNKLKYIKIIFSPGLSYVHPLEIETYKKYT